MLKFKTLPKLIVFDLDYTLWPFYIDTHFHEPFIKDNSGVITDRFSDVIECYPEVPNILKELSKHEDLKLGLASRTGATKAARCLVDLFDWTKYFHYSEIYPGDKTIHFKKFHEASQIALSEMLFFDDEARNILNVSHLGVTSILVHDGVDMDVLNQGLRSYQDKKQ